MDAERPVERVGDGLEVCEERDAAFEGGEFAGGDGRETRVFEGAGGMLVLHVVDNQGRRERNWWKKGSEEDSRSQRIRAQSISELLRLERADAASKPLLAIALNHIPRHEERTRRKLLLRRKAGAAAALARR